MHDKNVWEKNLESLDVIQSRLLTSPDGEKYAVKFGKSSSAYDVDFDAETLTISFISPLSGTVDTSQILHELGHYMIAPSEGLHLPSWGLANPYVAYSGLMFDPVHPGGSPAVTEARVWAWQHVMEVMCGFTDIETFSEHDEIEYLPGEVLNRGHEENIAIAKALTDIEYQKLLERHGSHENLENFVRNKIAGIQNTIRAERAFRIDEDANPDILESHKTPTRATISLTKFQDWYQVEIDAFDEGHTIVTTRDSGRALKMLELSCTCNDITKKVGKSLQASPSSSPSPSPSL